MRYRKQTQHIRRYRSGRWTYINRGVRYSLDVDKDKVEVWHGTAPINVDNIMKKGIIPRKDIGDADELIDNVLSNHGLTRKDVPRWIYQNAERRLAESKDKVYVSGNRDYALQNSWAFNEAEEELEENIAKFKNPDLSTKDIQDIRKELKKGRRSVLFKLKVPLSEIHGIDDDIKRVINIRNMINEGNPVANETWGRMTDVEILQDIMDQVTLDKVDADNIINKEVVDFK